MAKEKTREEQEREYKNKSASYEKKLKNKNNKFLIFIVVFVLLGYLFFLLSPKIFHEKPERFYSYLGVPVAFDGGTVTPTGWVYAENRDMMQVEFTFGSNKAIAPEIEVNAATSYTDRTKSSSRLKAEVIYHENDFFIANIYDIPQDYYSVSLRVKTIEDKNKESVNANKKDGLGNEVLREISETQSATENGKPASSTAVMYTCRDAVKVVYNLYPLENYIYRIKRIQSNINLTYSVINDNNTMIDTLKNENSDFEIKNDELRNDMLYMTSTEKQANEMEIESNTKKINDNITQINNLEEKNLSLQKEIHEYGEIIKRIAAENEGREYIAPEGSIDQQPTETAVKEPVLQAATERPTQASKPTQPPTQAPTRSNSDTKEE